MRIPAKRAVAILMLSCMSGNVMAATEAGCARPNEMAAVKTAAIQQRLMVAALSCDAVQVYNRFVATYRKDLQASDRELQNFFRRLHGKNGTEEYHSFKTRLANASSMASIGDIAGYCARAKQDFDEALNREKITLTAFVATRETAADRNFEPCPDAPRKAPRSKAVHRVLPAQGKGLTAPE